MPSSTSSAGTDYDVIAELYTELFYGEINESPTDRELIDEFVRLLAAGPQGVVLDIGCGPGHVTNYLHAGGLRSIGLDLSVELLRIAGQRTPDLPFGQSDIRALSIADQSLVGVLARYSLIHVPPNDLRMAFSEFNRVLVTSGYLAVSFFAVNDTERHGEPFDHKASLAYFLDVETMTRMLESAGFELVTSDVRPQEEGWRSDQAALLLRKR